MVFMDIDDKVFPEIGLGYRFNEQIAAELMIGTGKTTLVKHFNGLLMPTAGTVEVDVTDSGAGIPAAIWILNSSPRSKLKPMTRD